jgi:hypothetical protein
MRFRFQSNVKTVSGAVLVAACLFGAPRVQAEISGDKSVLHVEVECGGVFGYRAQGWDCDSGTQQIVGASKTQTAALTIQAGSPQNSANAATSSAYANFGRIGASVSASVNSGSPTGSPQPHTVTDSYSTARAAVSDFLTFNDAALTGTKGSFVMPVHLSGGLYVLSTGQALGARSRDNFTSTIDFKFETYDVSTLQRTTKVQSHAQAFVGDSGGTDYRGDVFPKELAITVPFVWGQPIWISMELAVDAESSAQAPGISPDDPLYRFPRSGSASADFSHTATFGGIASVLSDGQLVTDWSVTSASGADYRLDFSAPVPEPATNMLVLTGIGLLIFLTRQKKQVAA